MARLIPCPSCRSHVMDGDRECPHCGVSLRTTTARVAPAVLLGLALSGCPAEPAYGVPDSGEPPASSSDGGTTTGSGSGGTTTAAGSGSGSATGMTGTGATTGMADSGTTVVGEPEYGVAESTTSVGEPEYGVAESSGGSSSTSVGEPEYGVPE